MGHAHRHTAHQSPAQWNPAHHSLFDLWHLLSLDAPTVAALWCWVLGRATHLHLPAAAPLMLALGTWLLYVSDRLLDGWLARDASSLRERHRFHMRHRRAFLLAAAVVSAALLWLVPTRMPPAARNENAVLAFCALFYLTVVHLRAPRLAGWFPKELAVGLVFATATAVPTWARLGSSQRALLLPAIVLFAAVCWINCVAIEVWESETALRRFGSAQQPGPLAHWLGRHLRPASLLLAAVATAGALLLSRRGQSAAALPALLATLALSAVLLALLDRWRGSFSLLRLRVAADAALLTPVLLLPLLR